MEIYSPAKGSSIPDSTVFGLRLVTILKFTNTREFANQLLFSKIFFKVNSTRKIDGRYFAEPCGPDRLGFCYTWYYWSQMERN